MGRKNRFNISAKEAGIIAHEMSLVATVHPKDEIANAYARVSVLLENLHAPFAEDLTDLDFLIVKTFIANHMKG